MTNFDRILQCFNGRQGETFTTAGIKRMVKAAFGVNSEGVIPSDFCYNSWNKGRGPMKNSVFIKARHGEYTYVGLNYPHSGPVFWREALVVGQWSNGVCEMFNGQGHSRMSWPGLDSNGVDAYVNAATGNSTVVFSAPLPSTQREFEKMLKDLLAALDRLHRAHPVTDIYFPGGGRLIIPEWFLEWCRERGIKIHVVDASTFPAEPAKICR